MAIRNHTKVITTGNTIDLPLPFDSLYSLDRMKGDIKHEGYTKNLDGNNYDRFNFYESTILVEHESLMPARIKLMNEVTANIGATMNEIFDHSALNYTANDENQLKAQLIRHQLAGPMKIIQILLSFSTSEFLDKFKNDELRSKLIEQFLYKPLLFAQVNFFVLS